MSNAAADRFGDDDRECEWESDNEGSPTVSLLNAEKIHPSESAAVAEVDAATEGAFSELLGSKLRR